MKPAFVEARDLQEAYFLLIKECYEKGVKYEITEGSNKGGYRLELPFAAGYIHFPHTRPLAPIMPEGIPPTTTDEKIQEYFINYLMDPNLASNEEYRYSTWINKYIDIPDFEFGVTSPWEGDLLRGKETPVQWCINHFKEKGFGNNHCFITIGQPDMLFNYDKPYTNESERRTTPCLRGIDLKIKEGKVILGVVFRSWDLYAGFPENMGGFTLLNEYVANELGIEPGPLTFSSQGLHCYDYQITSLIQYLRR